jgi:DNA polymerase III epsilon subunit-like protein
MRELSQLRPILSRTRLAAHYTHHARITRPGHPEGLGLSDVGAFEHWRQDAERRGLFIAFDGEALHCWWPGPLVYSDLGRIERFWLELLASAGIKAPPVAAAPYEPEESFAGCWHAWHTTQHLTKAKAGEDEDAEPEDQGTLFAQTGERSEPPLCFVDVETTGEAKGGPPSRVLQLALCRVEPDGKERWFDSLINPDRDSEWFAFQVHKITRRDTLRAPRFSSILGQVLPLLEGALLVAHNGKTCDEPHLRRELALAGVSAPPWLGLVDTLHIARKLWPKPHKLGDLAERFGLEAGAAHDAKGDVITLRALWQRVRQERTGSVWNLPGLFLP